MKKYGRRKARLVLQGFKEPREWDTGSNVSPVAYPSTVRSLVFMGGEETDVLSSIDVSVAFLRVSCMVLMRHQDMCLISLMQELGSMCSS